MVRKFCCTLLQQVRVDIVGPHSTVCVLGFQKFMDFIHFEVDGVNLLHSCLVRIWVYRDCSLKNYNKGSNTGWCHFWIISESIVN